MILVLCNKIFLILGLYVVSTKMSGFTMEVVNSDPNMVICGIRVLLGNQDVARTPAYVEVLHKFQVV